MDNPTHSLIGLMLSRAGLNRFSQRADLILVLAANAPDIDVVSWIGGAVSHLCHHRGFTHAWIFLPLVAILPVAIGWLLRAKDRPFEWLGSYGISLAGVASHLLMDWTNTYAIRWNLPFSTEWKTADLLFVVDPYIWIVMAFALGGPWLSKLVSSEIGAKSGTGRGWAIFALLFVASYIGLRWQLHERALETLNSRLYSGEIPRRVTAVPGFASPARWLGVVELERSYWVLPVDLLQDFDPTGGRQYFKPERHPAIDLARATESFHCFEEFNKAPLWRVTPMPEPEGAVKVELFDLRFGTPVAPAFVASAEVVDGRVNKAVFQFGRPALAQ